MNQDAQRKEWDELSESQRNCLMWPDFLEWGEQVCDVEIRRQENNASLGLVSVAVQDPDTKLWYNITKRIKENHPAQGHINLYEWIFKVDDTETTKLPSADFSNLFKNGKDVVHLSLKKPVDALTKFVKEWGAEKIVTLNLKEGNTFKKSFKIVHFYSKGGNGNIINDRILVWEVKPSTDPVETSEPLHRGDELLEVNEELVKGKKLAEIYKLIFHKIPAEVKLKIKGIQRVQCNGQEVEPQPATVELEIEIPLNTPDTSVLQEDKSPEYDGPTQCLVVEKEMDKNVGREEKRQSEVHENISVLEESEDESPAVPGQNSPASKSKKKLKRLSLRRRLSSTGSPGGGNKVQSEIPTSENEGYKGTPPPERKFSPTSDNMCHPCVMAPETQRLSDDRNQWPIHKIENGFFQVICKLLDLDDKSKIPLLSALQCFTVTESACIRKKFEPKGGVGMADEALGKWGTSDRSHNVGSLKTIVEYKMKRVDVIGEIEKWEKLAVCHGCGIRLKK